MRAFPFVVAAMVLGAPAAVAQSSAGALEVIANGKTTVLSAAQLRALPRVSMRIADTNDSSTVSGISLWAILASVGTPPAEASGRQRASAYVRITGADGVSAVIALVEIDPSFSRRVVLVADQRDGKALDAVEGPRRVFVPDDIRHARWIRNLKTISIESVQR